MQGIFFGLGQMQGLGLQHLHGMGFIMAKLEAPDGLPVFSGPSYIEIASTRAGVGAGWPFALTKICDLQQDICYQRPRVSFLRFMSAGATARCGASLSAPQDTHHAQQPYVILLLIWRYLVLVLQD